MARFTVRQLDRRDFPAAWPLVRAASSARDLQDWVARADALTARGGGVLAVTPEEGGMHGIATFERIAAPAQRNVLRVDTLVTFELSSRAPVRRILCEALDDLADALGCDGVALTRPRPDRLAKVQ